jgi:hypothetical protein
MPGDTPQRDCAQKPRLFNAFARPEPFEAIAALALPTDSRGHDTGCGGQTFTPCKASPSQ